MQLTKEQTEVLTALIDGVKVHEVQTLGGYAGTGKTTVIKSLYRELSEYCVVAYTGKAANVLRKKGVTAQTIHSVLYNPKENTDEWGQKYTEWILKDSIPFSGIIVDEGSMVPEAIHEDLLSYGKPIIYVGDHGQLEPINSRFNIMEDPTYRLEKIHRNAGPIAVFANHLREGGDPKDFIGKFHSVLVARHVRDEVMSRADQVICAYNNTRVRINNKIREHLGRNKKMVNVGERVMCLRNNKDEMLFNGMQGTVTQVLPKKSFRFSFDDTEYDIRYDPNQFGKQKPEFDFRQKRHPFDYAYAITAHKAQGDEWGNVVVIEEKCKLWSHERWAYTAASRAKDNLIWITN